MHFATAQGRYFRTMICTNRIGLSCLCRAYGQGNKLTQSIDRPSRCPHDNLSSIAGCSSVEQALSFSILQAPASPIGRFQATPQSGGLPALCFVLQEGL